MQRLERYRTEEVSRFVADLEWVKAEEASTQIQRLEREIALMFSPREMMDDVDARDTAQKLVVSYEAALRVIAVAAGRVFRGATDLRSLPSLVDAVTERLAMADSRKGRKMR